MAITMPPPLPHPSSQARDSSEWAISPNGHHWKAKEDLREAKEAALAAVGLVAGLSMSETPGDRFRAMGWEASAPSAVAFPAPHAP